ncbi:unnamed protein product [Paramecium pentaurelia]|uniref:Uncharacterized protein n=1 Tax=Paramecium pentaurelia TaxID=43138 RepID=A0A8S1S0T8_9CILI|nr:unnamed protein product [Paramecium pentaurelia]
MDFLIEQITLEANLIKENNNQKKWLKRLSNYLYIQESGIITQSIIQFVNHIRNSLITVEGKLIK